MPKDLIVSSTMFPHHIIHKYTGTFPYVKIHIQIGNVLIAKRWHSSVIHVLYVIVTD